MSRIIGIDLGTTNTTLSTRDQTFSIPQRVDTGLEGESTQLPSFLYFPLPEEGARPFVGQWAKQRASETPDRVITSAKSWLCHGAIDRRAPLLPLNGEQKMSPVAASAAFLKQLAPLIQKGDQVLLTVPASFDPSARDLTLEAATEAGLTDVILLEEPQAAFYAWLHTQGDQWRHYLKVGETVLVIDCGGGTTDLSLIKVVDEAGELSLRRIKVGPHLLLGGDNMDMAFAYRLAERLGTLDERQFELLIAACRQAKERLFEEGQETLSIVIPGRGSRLIGGALKTTLTREEGLEWILEGFFPLVTSDEKCVTAARGLQQWGLPFAEEVRVTAHLAAFLAGEAAPDAILFNGGTLKPEKLRARLLEQIQLFTQRPVRELPGADLDYAVSRGAAYYGHVRQGEGIRIRGGINRSYFVGVEEARPAVPGFSPPLKAFCVAPFGMEEGTEQPLTLERFALAVGAPSAFRFFCSTKEAYPFGHLVKDWKQQLIELHPVEAQLEKQEGDGATIPVRLQSRVTELGILELWAIADDRRKWKLEFDLRKPS